MWTPATERITEDSQRIHRGIRARCRMRGPYFWHGLPEPNLRLLTTPILLALEMTVVDWRCVIGCGQARRCVRSDECS